MHSGKVGVQQRRSRSRAILCMIFESSSLARVSCFLMFLWVLKHVHTLGVSGLDMGLISRMPSLANLSLLYKHRSRNMISTVENSAVKLMCGCKPLMLLMNCSRLLFVSAHTRNISSIYLFQSLGEGFVSERILDSSVPLKMVA